MKKNQSHPSNKDSKRSEYHRKQLIQYHFNNTQRKVETKEPTPDTEVEAEAEDVDQDEGHANSKDTWIS